MGAAQLLESLAPRGRGVRASDESRRAGAAIRHRYRTANRTRSAAENANGAAWRPRGSMKDWLDQSRLVGLLSAVAGVPPAEVPFRV